MGRLAGVWITVAIAEVLLWRYFLSQPFYRDFMLPAAIAVVIAGLASSWRIWRGRAANRRAAERRNAERRRRAEELRRSR